MVIEEWFITLLCDIFSNLFSGEKWKCERPWENVQSYRFNLQRYGYFLSLRSKLLIFKLCSEIIEWILYKYRFLLSCSLHSFLQEEMKCFKVVAVSHLKFFLKLICKKHCKLWSIFLKTRFFDNQTLNCFIWTVFPTNDSKRGTSGWKLVLIRRVIITPY